MGHYGFQHKLVGKCALILYVKHRLVETSLTFLVNANQGNLTEQFKILHTKSFRSMFLDHTESMSMSVIDSNSVCNFQYLPSSIASRLNYLGHLGRSLVKCLSSGLYCLTVMRSHMWSSINTTYITDICHVMQPCFLGVVLWLMMQYPVYPIWLIYFRVYKPNFPFFHVDTDQVLCSSPEE